MRKPIFFSFSNHKNCIRQKNLIDFISLGDAIKYFLTKKVNSLSARYKHFFPPKRLALTTASRKLQFSPKRKLDVAFVEIKCCCVPNEALALLVWEAPILFIKVFALEIVPQKFQ